MNPWIAKGVVLGASVAMVVIRAPHGHRSRVIRVVKTRKGALETGLLTLAWLGFFVPLLWITSPFKSLPTPHETWLTARWGAHTRVARFVVR